jgi:hypothetical protein
VDADDVEALAADVLELVGRVRRHDEDVARAGLELVAVGGKSRGPAADDPRLGVGMAVQDGPFAGLVVHEEEGDARAIRLAFERDRPSGARPQLAGSDHSVHRRQNSF